MLHHILSCVTQIRFYRGYSYARIHIRVHKTFVDPTPVRVLWLKSHQESRDFVLLFHINADSDAKFHHLYEPVHRKWKWRFSGKAKKYKKDKVTEQTPKSKISKIIIALTTFFYTLIIAYHIYIRDFPKNWKPFSTPLWVGDALCPYCRAGKYRSCSQKMGFKWQ